MCNLVLYLLMEKGRFKKGGEGYPIIILGYFPWFSLVFLGFIWIFLAAIRVPVESSHPVDPWRPGSGVGGRDRAWAPPDRKAPFQPLDLVRGDPHSEVEPTVFVTPVHDLGMFVEPM